MTPSRSDQGFVRMPDAEFEARRSEAVAPTTTELIEKAPMMAMKSKDRWVILVLEGSPQSASARVLVPSSISFRRISVARPGSSKSGLWAEFSNV